MAWPVTNSYHEVCLTHLVWLRNDLRLDDNPALHAACQSGGPVMVVFIHDPAHEGRAGLGGARTWWLEANLHAFGQKLRQELGLTLHLYDGDSKKWLDHLTSKFAATQIYWNRSYEPAHVARDKALKQHFASKDLVVKSFAGNVLQEPFAITTGSGGPYRVFTPFWKNLAQKDIPHPLPQPKACSGPQDDEATSLADLKLHEADQGWGEKLAQYWPAGSNAGMQRFEEFVPLIGGYDEQRNRPDLPGTSKISGYLTIGALSVRRLWWLVREGLNIDDPVGNIFLSELGWRDFAQHLMFHFPTITTGNYKQEFDQFPWQEKDELFQAWKWGKTGYPIVDAGMRELYATGFMHNRLRMITASFLTKHLRLDWRHGEAWFWDCLVDADLASNTASWQWVAGSGADAAPYFRIFNPITQGEKFDPQGNYTRKYVPELAPLPNKILQKPWTCPVPPAGYPKPVVDHATARAEALASYDRMRGKQI